MDARKTVAGTRERLATTARKLLELLDREEVRAFQGMYYVLFTVCAGMLIWVPGMSAEYVSITIGGWSYDMWLWLTLCCPSLTILGRQMTVRASYRGPGESNTAYGGACFQLTGDCGVWASIDIYAYGLLETDWWQHHLYTSFFILMGVLGGGMFTLRSARRLEQIKRRDRHAKKHGWG